MAWDQIKHRGDELTLFPKKVESNSKSNKEESGNTILIADTNYRARLVIQWRGHFLTKPRKWDIPLIHFSHEKPRHNKEFQNHETMLLNYYSQ
jgi:hypothetical protein